ncbi:hypothetical protein QWY93_14540 [Echinicola jeungdonensis]|uniref:Transcription elongation factor n=1 Tax=Echinicola jeungdonensis TaxID=709343 RepID=A0ABV5JBT3_9BACT|nr:hypothetical protein [Echinicola jeungdonensis]MDN3670538.1 hypothetical protein [Echinicola jeungdonensis]
MKKHDFKIKVLEMAKKKQEQIINDFKSRIEDLKNSEIMINEDQYEYDQQSLDSSTNDMINHLADELNFALDELNFLQKMQVGEKPLDRVSLGSIVKTNKKTFFPSVSLENFSVNGQELFGISGQAPLYQLMKDKKVGDSFEYKGERYKILEIY